MILFMPAMVFNMVLTPIIGYCIAGKRKDRASDYVNISIKFSIVLVIVCGTLLHIFAKSIAGVFGCSAEAADLVQHIVRFLVWGIYSMLLHNTLWDGLTAMDSREREWLLQS